MFGGLNNRFIAAKLNFALSELIEREAFFCPAFIVENVFSNYYKLRSKGLDDMAILNLVLSCGREDETIRLTTRLKQYSEDYYPSLDGNDSGLPSYEREAGEVFKDYLNSHEKLLKHGVYR